jgi:hypothetical protein
VVRITYIFKAVVFLLLFGTYGCDDTKVAVVQLNGAWVLNEESRQRIGISQKAIANITLDEKGTFAASELPGEELYIEPQDQTRLISGTGVWRLISENGKQLVKLEFRTISDAKKSDVPFGTQLWVSNANSDTVLFYYHGDIDEGARVKFVKASRSSVR